MAVLGVQVLVDQLASERHSNSLVIRALQPPRHLILMLVMLHLLQLLGILAIRQPLPMVATLGILPSNLPTRSPRLLILQQVVTLAMEHSQLPILMLLLSRRPTVLSMVLRPPMRLQHIGRS